MPFRPKHILVCFISFLSAFLSAEEFRFTGFYDYFGGIEPSEGYENLDKRVYMNPSFSGYADNSGLEWTFSARLLVDPEGDTSSLDPWDILGEAYFFLPYGNFDFLLGQKIVTYGFADIYGPLNAANSANRATLSLDEKYDSRRPDPLFQIKYYPTFSDTFELTYIPVTRPDKEQDSPVYLSETSDSVNWSDDSYITESLHNVFYCIQPLRGENGLAVPLRHYMEKHAGF